MIQEIDGKTANRLIEMWCNEIDIPSGTWYTQEGRRWVAIDNRDGCCWVEDFDTKEEAIEWLG